MKDEIKQKLKNDYESNLRFIEEYFINIDKLNSSVKSLRLQEDTLHKEIKALNSIKDGLSSSSVELEKITEEITNTNTMLDNLKVKLSETEKQIETNTTRAKNISEQIEKDRIDFDLEVGKEREELNKLRVFVESESKRLDTKENDLKIIENRWRRLYEGKSLSFML